MPSLLLSHSFIFLFPLFRQKNDFLVSPCTSSHTTKQYNTRNLISPLKTPLPTRTSTSVQHITLKKMNPSRISEITSQIQSCRDMFWLRQLCKQCEQFLHLSSTSSAISPQQEDDILLVADIRDLLLLRIRQLEREMKRHLSAVNSQIGFGIHLNHHNHFSDDNINQFVDYLCYRLYCADCLIG